MSDASFARQALRRLDHGRPALGAVAGILVTALLGWVALGSMESLPILVAPMGASAVLLFAVPASPLAQPWSVIGGNVLSAFAGIACAKLIPDPLLAAGPAVGLAILVMRLARCLHPPGGAVALTCVIGGATVSHAGWSFALAPVGLNSAVLLAMAWAVNNATGHRYPHRVAAVPANPHGTADPAPQDRIGYTAADIDAVLARYDELLDVSREDLDAVFRQVEARAHRRLQGEIRCAAIMSRDLIVARADEGVGHARDRMLEHRLAAMPVVDDDGRLLGLVSHAELLAGMGRRVETVMAPATCRTTPRTPVDELLPLLSNGVHHVALVVEADGRLAGMITQTDLIAALWRGYVAERVAAGGSDGTGAPP
ncbi:HPP family protein [Zavarzinia sp. CC-PAN008]|uniref:HPP family protein n=1 Tax=Zavarzinia sp. CC-PAN008 TaxID=3243332 RepID=UPI003F74466E